MNLSKVEIHFIGDIHNYEVVLVDDIRKYVYDIRKKYAHRRDRIKHYEKLIEHILGELDESK